MWSEKRWRWTGAIGQKPHSAGPVSRVSERPRVPQGSTLIIQPPDRLTEFLDVPTARRLMRTAVPCLYRSFALLRAPSLSFERFARNPLEP